MSTLPIRRARGIALPVMLIMLAALLVSSIYLLRASNSTTLAASNLAYDSAMSRAAELGLHTGFQWLSATAATSKAALDADDAAHGYFASTDTTVGVRADAFWTGAQTVTDDAGNSIEYVVRRLCAMPGRYDTNNACVQTAANTARLGNTVALGESLAADAENFAGIPQLHYVITARVHGPRGGNVVSQLVVLIGV